MTFRLGLSLSAVLLVHPALPGQSDPVVQQVSLTVTTQVGPHGSFCEPFSCTPHYTTAAPGEVVRFDIGGAPSQPFVLFSGTAVPGCQPVVGIAGALVAWAPLTTLVIGLVNDAMPVVVRPVVPPPQAFLPCNPGSAVVQLTIPLGAPAGFDARFQVLALNDNATPARLEFSRAVEIRVH